MKTIAPVQAPVFAFFSKTLYKEVKEEWKGIAFLYLLCLTAILTLISSIITYFSLSVFIDKVFPPYIQQIPHVRIVKGKMTMDKASPYRIQGPRPGEDIVFDMSGATKTPDEAKAAVLFTETRMHLKNVQRGEERVLEYEEVVPEFETDANKAMSFVESLAVWIPVGIFVIGWPLAYLFAATQAAVYGAICLALGNIFKCRLSYGEGVRLAVMANTPVMIMGIIVGALNINPLFWSCLSIGVVIGYLCLACNANQDPSVI